MGHPSRIITIVDFQCSACPFSGRDYDGNPCCWLPCFLTNFNADPKTFDEGRFPKPPPSWCQLREGPVVVRFQDQE